jgi:electron transfer flavoprotein alpha subunit
MNNIFVFGELEDGKISDVSFELITKGRKLADQLKCKLDALVIGHNLKGIESQLYPYGVDVLLLMMHALHRTTLPHPSPLNYFRNKSHRLR